MSDPPATPETDPTPEAQARSRALRLLARRERTRRGLERSRPPRAVVDSVLDDLELRGLLSNLRFCRLYLGEQSHLRPRSVRLLRRDLLRAGADRGSVDRAIEEAGAALSDESLVLAAARKKLRTAGSDPARLSRLLLARGFSPGLVRRTLRELLGADPGMGTRRRAPRDEVDDGRD